MAAGLTDHVSILVRTSWLFVSFDTDLKIGWLRPLL
jgi:hypothetical protein